MRVYKASQLISIFVLGFLFLGNFSSVSKAQSEKTLPASEIILILDASGSMWGAN